MFPSPSLPVPALSVGQLYYRGLTFGGIAQNGVYNIVSFPEGLNPPDSVRGDAQRSQDEGEFAGVSVLPGREIVVVQNISCATQGYKPTAAQLKSLAEARMALSGVLGVKGSEYSPLWIATEYGTFGIMVQPDKHHFPWDSNVFLVGTVQATTSLHAVDPRFYLAPSNTASVGIPVPAGGLRFPVTFPITFPAASAGGVLGVTNGGLFEMRPVLVVLGPCTNPKITNLSIEGAPFVEVEIALNPGDTLTIDMDMQTVQYVAAGTVQGSSRRNSLVPGCTWWNLPPADEEGATGESLIEFTSSDRSSVAGTLTVQSASAYVGL
jgi:hypothetical protein